MTCSIICRYLSKAKSSGSKKKLLVCGPTNKSVVVLARKVMKCVEREDSLNVVLVGDKAELLSDNPELERIFVYEYWPRLARAFVDACWQLNSDFEKEAFKVKVDALVGSIKKKTPSTCTNELEEALQEISDAVATGKVDSDNFKEALKDVQKVLRAVDTAKVVKDLLREADVVFCTLSTAGSSDVKVMSNVTDLIVDEASACTESEALIPICFKPDKMLLVGDPKQLPATVMSPEAKKFGFARSLQERLMSHNEYRFWLLDTQYRMKPCISQWPVAKFYESKVMDGDNVKSAEYGSKSTLLLEGHPYVWVPVIGEEKKDSSGSTYNEREVDAVVAMILALKKKHKVSDIWQLSSPDYLRVITFYKAQEQRLREKLTQFGLNIMVSTVDAGQGCEADIVILSFVRGSDGEMGFIKDMQRLNVALTRAKYQLVCVGDVQSMNQIEQRGGHLELLDMAKDATRRSYLANTPEPLPPPPPTLEKKKMSPQVEKKPKQPEKKKQEKKKKNQISK
jgi:senataxin